MLKEAIAVFKKMLDEKGDALILDSYIPADGTYVIVDLEKDNIKDYTIKYDKKTKTVDKSIEGFRDICNYDYNSKLIDMNKPIDGKKIIHSNNYLSFFIKKESLSNGKLTEEIIDNYYAVLANPIIKYSKTSAAKELYETVEKEIGKVDIKLLEKAQCWIKNNIFNLPIEFTGKDYLKIFFKAPIEVYKNEGKRYLIPNIFNSNDFNVASNNSIYGLPNDNMGLNSKKPYLENKTRKYSVPYLISSEEVLIQRKFFDYLMNNVSSGKVNLYVNDNIKGIENGKLPEEDFTGMLLRLKKGKEVEIQGFDIVTNYKYNLIKKFDFKNILQVSTEKYPYTHSYSQYDNVAQIQTLINEIFFKKYLIANYFTEPKDIPIKGDNNLKENLLLSREIIFNWLYKGAKSGLYNSINKCTLSLIKGSIYDGYIMKASHQFNLRWSLIEYLKGGEKMSDIVYEIKENLRKKINEKNNTNKFENDEEYFFAVGQLVYFLLSKNKGNKKTHSLANPFINAKNDKIIKAKLKQIFMKYNYDIDMIGDRFNNLYAMVASYNPRGKVNQDMIIAGYLHSNLVYEKKEEN